MTVKFIEQREVSVRDLKPHPDNPNRGEVNAVAESLEQFGQYRSVVALKDLTILAGHHVVRAAQNIGMKTVRVDIIDADETSARKILLADNRIADLGLGPDFEMLLKNLEDLAGDFEGTGYDLEFQRLLEDAVNGPPEPEEDEDDEEDDGDSGSYRSVSLMLDARLADHWGAHRKLFPDDTSAFRHLLG